MAKRQLRLMEQYIQRFLQLGKPSETAAVQVGRSGGAGRRFAAAGRSPRRVMPASNCVGSVATTAAATRRVGDAERLGQMVINLLRQRDRSGGPRRALARHSPARVRDRAGAEVARASRADGFRHWFRPGGRRTTHAVRAVRDREAGRRRTGPVGRPRDRRAARRPDRLAPRRRHDPFHGRTSHRQADGGALCRSCWLSMTNSRSAGD